MRLISVTPESTSDPNTPGTARDKFVRFAPPQPKNSGDATDPRARFYCDGNVMLSRGVGSTAPRRSEYTYMSETENKYKICCTHSSSSGFDVADTLFGCFFIR